MEDFDFTARPHGKLNAKEKRTLMAKFTDEVAGEFNAKHIKTVEAAAIRTGMYLTIDESDLTSMVPVKYASFNFSFYFILFYFILLSINISIIISRFSPDFGESLTSQHPLHHDAVEYKPLVIPPREEHSSMVITVVDPVSISADVQGNRSRITSEMTDTSAIIRVTGDNARVSATSNSSASIRIRGRTRAVLSEGISNI